MYLPNLELWEVEVEARHTLYVLVGAGDEEWAREVALDAFRDTIDLDSCEVDAFPAEERDVAAWIRNGGHL